MNTTSRLLQQPEYVHTVINHFPMTGLLIALLALIIGLIARSKPATILGLILVFATCLSAWPVFEYGEGGYYRVLSMADVPGQAYLKYHSQLAHQWVFVYYVTAGVALLIVGFSWKWDKVLLPGSILTVLLAAASLAAGLYIAQPGGGIRHREFRHGPAPEVQEETDSY